MDVTRVGLAGAGWVSEHHLDAYSSLRGRAQVVAIADPRIGAAKARAERYGIPSVYASAQEMLADQPLDALDIAAPREHHVRLCHLAAHYGLAALCQKPLAPTFVEAEQLVDELGGQVRLMVHDNWRFRPHYRRVGQWIRAGRIGAIRGAFMANVSSGLLPDADGGLPALVRQPMLAGLDRMLLMEVMIHHVDTLRFLLGPLRLEAARLAHRCDRIRGEDYAALFLRAADGGPVTLLGDFMARGYPPEQRDRLEILGTAGSITLRDGTLRLVADIEETFELDLQADYKASYRDAIAHFLDRLTDGAPFETSAQDNLRTLSIVEEAYDRAPAIARIRSFAASGSARSPST